MFAIRSFIFCALANALIASDPEGTKWNQLAMSNGPGKWQFTFGNVPKHHALVLTSISIQLPNGANKASCRLVAADQIHDFRLGTERANPAYVIPGPARLAVACQPHAPIIGKASARITGQLVKFPHQDRHWKSSKGSL